MQVVHRASKGLAFLRPSQACRVCKSNDTGYHKQPGEIRQRPSGDLLHDAEMTGHYNPLHDAMLTRHNHWEGSEQIGEASRESKELVFNSRTCHQLVNGFTSCYSQLSITSVVCFSTIAGWLEQFSSQTYNFPPQASIGQ